MKTVSLNNALTDLLRIDIPLIQAPMAGVSTPELAAAVSNAGALGSVALGALAAPAAHDALLQTRARTDRPIAANVFVHPTPRANPLTERRFLDALEPLFSAFEAEVPRSLNEIYRSFNDDEALLDVLLELRPDLVSLHFGLASEQRMSQLHNAGLQVIGNATSLAEARLLRASGVDAIVLQSDAAGGHSGRFLPGSDSDQPQTELPGFADLVTEVAAQIDCPIVAAGGLMDGADIHALMQAGAAGVQLGTAFIGCPETLASDTYRSWLKRADRTEVTTLVSGRPARGLINPLLQGLAGALIEASESIPDYPRAYDATKQLVAAAADPAFSVMWAGAGVARTRFLPATELVQTLAKEWADAAVVDTDRSR